MARSDKKSGQKLIRQNRVLGASLDGVVKATLEDAATPAQIVSPWRLIGNKQLVVSSNFCGSKRKQFISLHRF